MSRARVTRRLTALTAATALLSAAGLASGALVGVAAAETADSVTPNTVSNAGTAPTTVKVNGSGFNPQGTGESVSFKPTQPGDEAVPISGTVVPSSSTSTQLVVTVPFYFAAPVPYDVVVTTKAGNQAVSSSTCSSCLLVTNPGRPTVTGVTANGGGGYVTIAGTNFAKGAKVTFLKPDFSVDPALTFSAGRTDSSGNHVNGIVSPTRIDGQTAHTGQVMPGKHFLKVTNLGDPSGSTQTVEFWQPVLSTTAPAKLGQGAKSIPVTVSGAGIRSGSSLGLSQFVSKNPATMQSTTTTDITVGSASVSAGGDSITAPVTVSNAGGPSTRTAFVTGPDGGFDAQPSLSVVAPPTVSGSPDSSVASPVTFDTTALGQGASQVPATIDGSNFAPDVTFGAGPGVTIKTTGVKADGTQAKVTISIAPNAPVGDVTTLTATNPTDHGTSDYVGDGQAATYPFTIDAGPVITSIGDSLGRSGLTPGSSKKVTLTGTGFNTASSGVLLTSTGGLSFTGVVVNSATNITATAVLAAGSATGTRDVTILNKNDHGMSTCVACLGVDALSISPQGGTNTDAARELTFTAADGSALNGITAAGLRKTGGSPSQPDLVGTPTATAGNYTFDLTNAAPGNYDGTATLPSGVLTCTGCFRVAGNDFTLAAAPGTITPATGGQGATSFPITLHGTGFARGERISIAGTTISDTTFVDPKTLTATITIPSGAATGAKDVIVSSADGNFSHTVTGAYTVVAAPTITSPKSDAPARIGQGATNFDVPITGTGFTDSSITVSGADVTGTVTRTDATHLVAHLTVAATAATGVRDITVTSTDNGGSATSAGSLLVTDKPTVTLVSPAKLGAGETASITVSGQGFQPSSVVSIANVTFSGTPTVSSDGTTITANGTVAGSAPQGARNVNVDNPDGGHGTCSSCFTVTAPKAAPSFTLGTRTIAAGQRTKVLITGTAGDQVQVGVKGAASSAYTSLATVTLNSAGQSSVIVSPSTNSSYVVSNSTGVSPAQALVVKAVQSLVVKVSGRTGVFTGHIAPSVVGRTVLVYFYADGAHVATACSTKTTRGGQYKCQHTFPAGTFHTFAQTNADTYNAAGRSSLHTNAF